MKTDTIVQSVIDIGRWEEKQGSIDGDSPLYFPLSDD
jgi:hypothetical protein